MSTQVSLRPKEVARLLGITYDGAKRRLATIRRRLGKPADTLVSVGEFCRVTGLPEEEVRAALGA